MIIRLYFNIKVWSFYNFEKNSWPFLRALFLNWGCLLTLDCWVDSAYREILCLLSLPLFNLTSWKTCLMTLCYMQGVWQVYFLKLMVDSWISDCSLNPKLYCFEKWRQQSDSVSLSYQVTWISNFEKKTFANRYDRSCHEFLI